MNTVHVAQPCFELRDFELLHIDEGGLQRDFINLGVLTNLERADDRYQRDAQRRRVSTGIALSDSRTQDSASAPLTRRTCMALAPNRSVLTVCSTFVEL